MRALYLGIFLAAFFSYKADAGMSREAVEAVLDERDQCEQVLRDVERIRNTQKLMTCMDFYFNNPMLDPEPASFNAIIRIGYRILELEPTNVPLYGNVSWMLWSKWANWKRDPSSMPDGEAKLQEAITLLENGARRNPHSADFFVEAGNTLAPIIFNHDTSVAPHAIDWYQRADGLLSLRDTRKVRVRLNLGHIFRKVDRISEARESYESVLRIDPKNKVALRALEQLKP